MSFSRIHRTRLSLTLLLWWSITANLSLAWVPPVSITNGSAAVSNKVVRFAGPVGTEDLNVGEHNENNRNGKSTQCPTKTRRGVLRQISLGIVASTMSPMAPAFADDDTTVPVELTPLSTDAKKLFNEGRALESQGNMMAAQRLYSKVTKISPRFVYGWSNLGNTQVALGDLLQADDNYSKAIRLCEESAAEATAQGFGIKKCNDLYVLLLNRGSVRLNTPGQKEEALKDLRKANTLRERPDAVILQNLARAEELNGFYSMADKNYNLAISMTANEVNPFWLRSAMVKLQLGDLKGGRDLLKRVENRFPDAPEVKAASATFLWAAGQQTNQPSAAEALLGASASSNSASDTKQQPLENYQIDAQRKFLEIPDRPRLRFVDSKYLEETVAWPPMMIEGVTSIARAVGDYNRVGGSAEVLSQ